MESARSVKWAVVICLIQVLCNGSVHAVDSNRKIHTAVVRGEQQMDADGIMSAQTDATLLLEFQKSGGLRRKKREWLIPPIGILENDRRGPFPKYIGVQIKSSYAKETKMEYSITGVGADQPPVDLFTIDGLTGQIYVSRPLDREETDRYVLQAHSKSIIDANLKEPVVEVIINVLDMNDNHPIFTQDPFLGSVPEASKIGFKFMTVSATDADDPNTDNAEIRFSIASQIPEQPNPNMFEINPVSGAIRVNSDGLDRETVSEYTLEIHAADMAGEGRPVIGKAVITVTDSTILKPRPWLIPPIRVTENERGPFPKEIVQMKPSNAKTSGVKYSITGIGANLPPVGLFLMDESTGKLSVSEPLDRETKAKYELEAHITGPNIHEIVEFIIQVVDQNDNRPGFTKSPFFGEVSDTAEIGFSFMTIKATDADDSLNTNNADIRYSIISQAPAEPKADMFAIDPISGVIQVNAKGLDFSKHPKYTLKIEATDMKGNGISSTGDVVISITDSKDEPRLWLIPPIRILENDRGPFPKEIVQIKPSNAETSELEYSINGIGGNLPPVGLFLMDKNTGKLSVSGPLDRETKAEYDLEAHMTGPNTHDTRKFIIHVVDINDNKPVFTQSPFIGKVSDAAEIGFPVMTIRATDADSLNNADIRYSIISQAPAEPKADMFAIDPISGVIQVNAKGLDFSKHPEYTLKIHASDMAGNGIPSIGDAVISITDSKDTRSPEILEISPICFSENGRGPFPKYLFKLRSSQGKQTKTTFRLTGEGADQDPVGLFTVDENNGWVSVTKPLDREIKHEYVLQAHTDGDQPTELTICVIDQNDNRPVFTQSPFLGNVSAASKAGFKFLTISATDADDPKTQNANIRYSIISQNPALPQPDMFEINPDSGEIQVKSEGFEREKYPEYTLEIQAADMQGNGFQSKVKAIITVTA